MKYPLLLLLLLFCSEGFASKADSLNCSCCDTVIKIVCKQKAPWCLPEPVKQPKQTDTVYIEPDGCCDTTIVYNNTVECTNCCPPDDCIDSYSGREKHSKWFRILMGILDFLKKLIGVLAALVSFYKALRELNKLNKVKPTEVSETRVTVVSKFTIWFITGSFFLLLVYMPSFLLPMFRMIYVAMGGVILGTVSILSICGAVYLLIKAIKGKPEKEYIASVNRVDFDDRVADVERKKNVDKSGNKENLDSGRVLTILLLVAVLVMVGIQTIFLFTIKFNTSVVITNNISVYSPVVWLVGGLLLLFIVLGLLLLINRWSKEDELQSIYTNKEQSYWQPVQVRPLIEIDWKFVAGVLSFIAAELVAYGLMRQATCGIVWHQAVLPVLILILLIVMVFVYYRFVKPDSTSSFSKNLIIASKLLTQLQLLTAGKRTPDINVLFGYSAYISKLLTEEGYELQLTGHGRELAEKTLNVFGEIELRRNVDSYNREKDKELEELVMYYTDYLNRFVKLYS